MDAFLFWLADHLGILGGIDCGETIFVVQNKNNELFSMRAFMGHKLLLLW